MKNKFKLVVLIILFLGVVFGYLFFYSYSYYALQKYNYKLLPNTYIENLDMSDCSYKSSIERLEYYNDYLLSKIVRVNVNTNVYDYTIKDLGITINKEETINNILKKQKKLSNNDIIKKLNKKKKYELTYTFDDFVLLNKLNEIKSVVDVEVVNGYFDTNNGVVYNKGVNGYSLNIESSINEIKQILEKDLGKGVEVTLVGDVVNSNVNDNYATIDTMTSSFVTTFMPNTYARNINLNTALGYINGTIVQPGEIFSYCNKAGPFNKAGYVFYYEFVGNGVCQIATTTYNAALLGGLEIVKRYPHAKKSLYVEGGLDATVASYSGGWCVDMQFKNTYKYPIYIKAYSEGGRAHVEFWSNSNAKEGKEYTTESVKIGPRGYISYLHTFKDGVEIDKKQIATTWYTEG